MPLFGPELRKAGFSFKALSELYQPTQEMRSEQADGAALVAVARLIATHTGDPLDAVINVINVVRFQARALLHSPEGWRAIASLYPGVNTAACHPTIH